MKKIILHNSFILSKFFLIFGILLLFYKGGGLVIILISLAYISQKSRRLNIQTKFKFNPATEYILLILGALFFVYNFISYPVLRTPRILVIQILVLVFFYSPYFVVRYYSQIETKLTDGVLGSR